MKINLNTCVKGQKLKSKQGKILTYLGKTGDLHYPHKVQYPSGEEGTRTDDGYVFILNQLQGDEDIVEILPLETPEPKKEKFTIVYRHYNPILVKVEYEYISTDNLPSVLENKRFYQKIVWKKRRIHTSRREMFLLAKMENLSRLC